MAQQGRYEEGIPLMQESQAVAHAAGADIGRSNGLCLLAEAYMKADRLDDALIVLGLSTLAYRILRIYRTGMTIAKKR